MSYYSLVTSQNSFFSFFCANNFLKRLSCLYHFCWQNRTHHLFSRQQLIDWWSCANFLKQWWRWANLYYGHMVSVLETWQNRITTIYFIIHRQYDETNDQQLVPNSRSFTCMLSTFGANFFWNYNPIRYLWTCFSMLGHDINSSVQFGDLCILYGWPKPVTFN